MSTSEFQYFDENNPERSQSPDIDNPIQTLETAYSSLVSYSITGIITNREQLTRAYWYIAPPQIEEMSEDHAQAYFTSLIPFITQEGPAESMALQIRQSALFVQDIINKIIHQDEVDSTEVEFAQVFIEVFTDKVRSNRIPIISVI